MTIPSRPIHNSYSMKCVIYCRQSNAFRGPPNNKISFTASNSPSLTSQEQLCKTYCKNNNIKVIGIHKDINISARNFKNHATIAQLLRNVGAGDKLIISSVDRLSRNCDKCIEFLNDLKKAKIDVYSVKENISYIANPRKFKRHLTNAQNYSDTISSIIKSRIKSLKTIGWHFGKPRFGYTVQYTPTRIRKITKDTKTQSIITRIITYVKAGHTYAETAKKLSIRRKNTKSRKNSTIWTAKKVGYIYRKHTNHRKN